MDSCCEAKTEEIKAALGKHRNVLTVVLIINAVLFFVEATAGVLAHSTSLLADSLDMLGDSLVYGFSLFVLRRSAGWSILAAIFKGIIMVLFGFGVLAEAIYKTFLGVVPVAETMGAVGLLALLANAACFLLLFGHRSDNLNMRSTWLCSRNDLIANMSVLLAAAGVGYFRATWPDVLIGGAIALLFLRTSLTVLRESFYEYRGLKKQPQTFSSLG